MEEILHQLIGSFPQLYIYKVFYIPSGAGFLPSTVLPSELKEKQVIDLEICRSCLKVSPGETLTHGTHRFH